MVEFIVAFLFVLGLIVAIGAAETSFWTALAGVGLIAAAVLIAYIAERKGYQFKA